MAFRGFRAGTADASYTFYPNDSSGGTFSPIWQPMLLGDGGNIQGVHVFPSGTVLAHADTYNGFLLQPGGGSVIGGKTLAAPSWQPMLSFGRLADQSLASAALNAATSWQGMVDIVEHPGNTNVFFCATLGFVWVSANRGLTWNKTTMTFQQAANGGPIQTQWIAGDPNDTTGNVVYVNTASGGCYKSTNALSGTSSTFTPISGIAASTTGGGGSIVFDPSTSGASQKIWISSDGVGIYQAVGSGAFSLLNTTGMPTRTGILAADKFGQLWSGTGFYASSFTVSVYASGAWVTRTVTNINSNQYLIAIVFDPNTGSLVANNHVIAVLSQGDLSCSLDNGANWTGVGISTISSAAPQAAWMASAKQDAQSIKKLNVNGGAIDSSGKVYIPAGISVWTSPNPITAGVIAGSVSYQANSVGIEQFVVSGVWSFPGNSPISTVWDRGFIYNLNPDEIAAVQFPQTLDILDPAFSMDYALVSGSASLLVGHACGANAAGGTSSDGGATWALWPTFPTGYGAGGIVAVGSALNWVCCPGNSGGAQNTLYYTTDGGLNWLPSSVPGSPQFVPGNNMPDSTGCVTVVAEKGNPGTFYAVDIGATKRILKSTNNGASFAVVATNPSGGTINFNGKVKLRCVPGKPGELFLTGYPNGGANIWKSTDSGVNWAVPAGASAKNFENITSFGFGAPLPGGSGYPTIYINTSTSAGIDYTTFYSTDAGLAFNKLNVPIGQQTYPLGSFDYPTWIEGDPNVYGRVYLGFVGSGVAYIDTADACPWVNFYNIKPNASLTGTITLTAKQSGLVPVTSVQFSVDGVNIGAPQTGAGPWSVPWITGGVSPGTHTLKITAIGANGSGSFSIPITTH